MLTELVGLTLTRSIPDNALIGVVTGAYKIYGGVIRNASGQIVAHLINGSNPLTAPIDAVLNGINSVQLLRIGKEVAQLKDNIAAAQSLTTQIVTLAKGTMSLSGLTLGVSAAGFIFLNRKLGKIDESLQNISKDIKAIRQFLDRQERARLVTAFKTLSGVYSAEEKTRIPLLVNSRQTLGEIHENYRELFHNIKTIQEVNAVEEYFSVTALGQSMCSAELDMPNQAHQEFDESYKTWLGTAQRIARDMIFRGSPERFMTKRFVNIIRTDELIDCLDFANGTERQLEWIDDLRGVFGRGFTLSDTPTVQDKEEAAILKRLVARNRIFLGYASQLEYLAKNNLRPSQFQNYIEALPESSYVDDCVLLVANAVS